MAAAAAGVCWLANYQIQFGARSAAPETWPKPPFPALDARRDTLVLFAHPRCPCSRASLEELNRILAGRTEQIAAHVLFLNPTSISNEWTQTSLRKAAEAIKPLQVRDDPDGEIARQFGAATSGFVVLYSPDGKLLFSGGITAARGHAGDSASKKTLLDRIARRDTAPASTPVFGCSLYSCDTNMTFAELRQ